MAEAKKTGIVLSIDMGGTNMNLACVRRGPSGFEFAASRRYPTSEQSGALGPIRDFLEHAASAGLPAPEALCLASAGVISEGRIDSSNVPWALEREPLQEALGIPVVLINDFQAVMRGILSLDRRDDRYFALLKPARPESGEPGPICAIGPGTGLGFGYALPLDSGYDVFPSEGGGTLLPVWDEESNALRHFLHARLGGEPTAEDAVSGPGIARIFDFEVGRLNRGPIPDSVVARILRQPETERPRAISEAAASDETCARAMERFALTLASVASGAALAFIPTGGLFLAGGVSAKNLSHVGGAAFIRRFLSHRGGAYVRLLDRIPLYAVKDYSISLIGSAEAAFAAADSAAG
jgi:glucokinase